MKRGIRKTDIYIIEHLKFKSLEKIKIYALGLGLQG